MKNSLKYLKLWQKKRSELQIDDDPRTDWDQMQSLLDQHMPAANKPSRFKGFRMLPALFITFSAAAMVYVASNVYTLEKRDHRLKSKFHKGNPLKPGVAPADSLNAINSAANKDSLLSAKPPAAKDSGLMKPGVIRKQYNDVSQNDGSIKSGISKTQANGPASNAVVNKTPSPQGGKHNALLSGPLNINKSGHAITRAQSNKPANTSFTGDKTANGKKRGGRTRQVPFTGPGRNSVVKSRGYNKANGQKIPGAENAQSLTDVPNDYADRQSRPNFFTLASPVPFHPFTNKNGLPPGPLPGLNNVIIQNRLHSVSAGVKNKNNKTVKTHNGTPSSIDWGILLGVNTSGSFTPKNQNSNFYGSSPVDAYFGLFATFRVNNRWAINPQIRLFSPQTIATSYTHANQSSVDSGQSLSIKASRKIYAVNIPVYVVYNAGNGLSFKAGPVISFPVKQINATSTLLPDSIRSDTVYYRRIRGMLDVTQYQQKINFGFSAGASFQVKRWIFEAAYLKSLSGYGVTSGLGSYKSYNGTIQFTIGFQLDKLKP